MGIGCVRGVSSGVPDARVSGSVLGVGRMTHDNPLFNVRADSASEGAVGVITGPQATLTFTGAPIAVTLVWQVLGVGVPALARQTLVPIGLSLVVGMLIYWQSARTATTRERVTGLVLAIINSFAIAAATLGIHTTVWSGGAAGSGGGP